MNPYQMEPGTALDEQIHRLLFEEIISSETPPNYSIDPALSRRVRTELSERFGHPVVVGETKTIPRKYFARLDSDPSTATEVLAPTQPLAICRLAVVLLLRKR
jgi:hypothetical protein